jgi:hypothetical protein
MQFIERGNSKMKKIVLDGETQEPIDELELKNNDIKAKLEVVLREFLDERDEMKMLKKATKLGYRFTKQLYYELAKYPPMSIDDFASLDYDTLNDLWLHYLDLTAYYNRYFEIVDNKQLWCAYSGLNSRQYSQLEKSDDEDIRNLMNSINSAFIGLGFIAAESGNADVKGVNQRLRSSGEAGHSVVTAAEEKVIEQGMGMTDDELAKKLLRRGIAIVDENRRLK